MALIAFFFTNQYQSYKIKNKQLPFIYETKKKKSSMIGQINSTNLIIKLIIYPEDTGCENSPVKT